jgi:hypothetical protein
MTLLALDQGGMSCCHHGYVLLDADQTPTPNPDHFYLKWRFYHEDFDVTRHQNTFRVWWMTGELTEAYL